MSSDKLRKIRKFAIMELLLMDISGFKLQFTTEMAGKRRVHQID